MQMTTNDLSKFSVCELGAIMHYIKKVSQVLEMENNNLTVLINNEDVNIRAFAHAKRSTLSGVIEQLGFDYDTVFNELERKCKR